MPQREDYPVTAETIKAAIAARDAERAAAGIVCDKDGKILFEVDRKRRTA